MPSDPILKVGPMTPGNSLQMYNDLVEAVQRLVQTVGDRFNDSSDDADPDITTVPDFFFGVTANPPEDTSDPDFTGCQYWIKRCVTPKLSSNPSYFRGTSLSDEIQTDPDSLAEVLPIPDLVIATHLAEVPTDGSGGGVGGTHNLPLNTFVLVVGIANRFIPNQRTYVCIGPTIPPLLYRITADYGGNGYYTAYLQRPIAAAGLPDPTVDLDLATYFEDVPGVDTVVVQNVSESITSCHRLQVEGTQYVIGWRNGNAADVFSFTSQLIQCDVDSPMIVGTWNCLSDPSLCATWNDKKGIGFIDFLDDDFTLDVVGKYRFDRAKITWNGFTVNDAYTSEKHCHIKAISFDDFNPAADPTDYSVGYTPLRARFDITDITLTDATCPPDGCSYDKAAVLIEGTVYAPKLGLQECLYGGVGAIHYLDPPVIQLGAGLAFTAPNIIGLCLIDGDYTTAEVVECCWKINVCTEEVTVATGEIESASEGDPGAFPTAFTLDPDTCTISATAWSKLTTATILQVVACP